MQAAPDRSPEIAHPASATMIGRISAVGFTGATTSPEPRRRSIKEAPSFQIVLIAVILITVLAGTADVVMALVWASPTDMQKGAFSDMETVWKMGFGALVGLLGGKYTR